MGSAIEIINSEKGASMPASAFMALGTEAEMAVWQKKKQMAAVLMVFLLVGCTTSTKLTGGRDDLGSPTLRGVPFTLTKPTFKLTAQRATAERPYPVYSLEAQLVPDPNNRFTLALSPAEFTEADFKLVFGALGQPIEINSETRDQIIPTVKAIGSFLVSAVSAVSGAAGIGAAFDKAAEPDFASDLNDYFQSDCAADTCFEAKVNSECNALREAWTEVKSNGKSGAGYFALNDTQLRVLELAGNHFECAEAEYRGSLANLKRALCFAQNVGNECVNALKLEGAGTPSQLEKFESDVLPAIAATIRPEFDKVVEAQKYLLKRQKAIAEVAEIEQSWRHRYATFLEEEIDLLEQKEIIANGSSTPSQAVLDKKLLLARTIRAGDEYNRILELRKALSAVVQAEMTRVRPLRETAPFTDYQVAQTELKDLEAAFASKRAALIPKPASSTPTPPAERILYPAVYWKLDGPSTGANVSTWVQACAGDSTAPACATSSWNQLPVADSEFVIVIEKGVNP